MIDRSLSKIRKEKVKQQEPISSEPVGAQEPKPMMI